MPFLWYCISGHIGDNVPFWFGGRVDIYAFPCEYFVNILFFFVHICCFCNFFFFAMLLIGYDLHHIYGLHVIGVFNLFEHCISLEIPVFNSCVELERLHVFDPCFTCTLA